MRVQIIHIIKSLKKIQERIFANLRLAGRMLKEQMECNAMTLVQATIPIETDRSVFICVIIGRIQMEHCSAQPLVATTGR